MLKEKLTKKSRLLGNILKEKVKKIATNFARALLGRKRFQTIPYYEELQEKKIEILINEKNNMCYIVFEGKVALKSNQSALRVLYSKMRDTFIFMIANARKECEIYEFQAGKFIYLEKLSGLYQWIEADNLSLILVYKPGKSVIYDFEYGKIIYESFFESYWFKEIKVFVSRERNGEWTLMSPCRPENQSAGLTEILKLDERPKDTSHPQIVGNRGIIVASGKVVETHQFELIEPADNLPIPYKYFAYNNAKVYALGYDEKNFYIQEVPGKMQLLAPNIKGMERYFVVKNEKELSILESKAGEFTKKGKYPNGIDVSFGDPYLDFETGGIFIPVNIKKDQLISIRTRY